jgi:hypothetical protein
MLRYVVYGAASPGVRRMSALLPILAQPLAPDYIWLAFLLLAAMAWMHRLDTLRGRMAGRQPAQHHLHGIGHRLRDRTAHTNH